MDSNDEFEDAYRGMTGLLERPPAPINWNLLEANEADIEWHDLDLWVTWLKVTFGLPPSIVPPHWHRHDELVWELSALHTHWLSCHHESANASAPIAWLRDFAEARNRLRDWVAICGTRLDRDRPTRQTVWPGERAVDAGGEVPIKDPLTQHCASRKRSFGRGPTFPRGGPAQDPVRGDPHLRKNCMTMQAGTSSRTS